VASRQGTLDAAARISVRTGCGSLNVTTALGNAWRLNARNTAGRSPAIQASGESLSIDATGANRWSWSMFDAGRDAWDLTLPTTDLDELSVVAFASRDQVALPGAHVRRLAVTANATDIVIDASTATVAELSAVLNLGSISVHLPSSDLTGSIRVGGGELQLCIPQGLGLRVTWRGLPRQVTFEGVQQTGSDWQSADYATASHRADLRVTVDFGAVKINPIGGCK
jgi:hypothetical protein